jgi:hypothetical protein
MRAKARLIDYGICQPLNESIYKTSDSPTGYFLEADKLIFTERTDKLRIRKGLVFGISYHLENSQDAFLSRILHPTLVKSATDKPFRVTTEEKCQSTDGLNFDYYRLEHSWEMVAGQWTFQIEQSSNVLIEKSFELYH